MSRPPSPIPLEEAQARLFALATPLPVEHVDVERATGRYLASPVVARRTQPIADLSAMDGYAVKASDMAGPWRVVGESAAGHPYNGVIRQGEAVRISTGAIVPADADAVIVQEDLARQEAVLRLTGEAPAPVHKHIRHRGMDFDEGGEVMPAGLQVGPAQVALALASGHTHLPVSRPPRIAVIDSGDELAADPTACGLHQIPASNGAMLLAMARILPVEAKRIGPVPDRLDALTSAFAEAADADVIVSSGGASVGDHDLVRPALEAWGAKLDFWRVAIKPGKPILIATRDEGDRRQIILGLPGNPISSYVTAYHFMLPLIRHLMGARESRPRPITARLGAPLRGTGPRREFLRGWWDGHTVVAHTLQDSGALSSLSASNVMIDRPALSPPADEGENVPVFLLQNGGLG